MRHRTLKLHIDVVQVTSMGVVSDFEKELRKRSPYSYGRWHSVDLHNHSPTSFDYRGNRTTAVDDTVSQISKARPSVVMFTDHVDLPDAKFVDEVRQRTGCLVLRGVELNVFVDAWQKPEGKVDKNLYFHLLVGFDPEGNQTPDYWLQEIFFCKRGQWSCCERTNRDAENATGSAAMRRGILTARRSVG